MSHSNRKVIPYGRQWVNKKDVDAVIDTLKSDFLTQGPKVREFEDSLAKHVGARYAIATNNGTSALHLAYLAAGLKRGDEIITSPNTFVATTNMLLAVGAKPIFCDIQLDIHNIDEKKIEKLITKKTRAIVPIHFAGHPCEMDAIKRIAKKYKLLVIEDAAQALGAKYKKRKIGSIGDMTMFSFHPVKSLTTGEGGVITTDSKEYYEKMKSLRSHGIHKDKNGKNVMTELGYNYRMTDIQAALGISQLVRLDSFIDKRHQVARWYKRELSLLEKIILPTESKHVYSGWHIYVIKTKRRSDRDKLMSYLKKEGVGVNLHYPAVYAHPYYRKNGYRNVQLPNEEKYQSTCITLPIHPQLTKSDVRYISRTVKDFFHT